MENMENMENTELKKRIEDRIAILEKDGAHLLEGTIATIFENAPRALLQNALEAVLAELYALLGKKYVSKLKRQGG